MYSYPIPVTIDASERHVGTVIFCHGMSDNSQNWANIITKWSWPQRFPHMKFILPGAPCIPVTLAKGHSLSAWYDVLTPNDILGGKYDEAGLAQSRAHLESLVHTEIKAGIRAESIILGGFSQGAAMALYTGLTTTQAPGGVFALSGYLPMLPEVRAHVEQQKQSRATKFYMGNGTNDMYVKHPWAQWSAEVITCGGYELRFESYLRGQHDMHKQSIADVTEWLSEIVPYDISYELIDDR